MFFPIVFDPTKETLLNPVSRIAHLKITWMFLQGFAVLTGSHTFSRLVQTAAEGVYTCEITASEIYMGKRQAKRQEK